MIGKIIWMNRKQRRAALRRLRENLFALTRYIVDADPYGLIADLSQDVVSLSDYALAVEAAGIEPGEKVEAFGVRNLIGTDLADWQAEMLAVAARPSQVERPVVHIILSLQEGETWTEEQREEAITIILETLGLERCQVVWAEHSNTANAHLHLSIVRVDPLTGMKAGSDWLIDDLHQALALVEERQGRAREPGALYVASAGAVYDADTNIMVRNASGKYISGWYKALGQKHDRTPARMRPKRASIIAAGQQAQSWSELHLALEEIGVTYDRSGSGARIAVNGASVIASEVHGSLSRPELEKRLGPFEPDLSRLSPAYEAYRNAFDSQLKSLRSGRDNERVRLAEWVSTTLATLPPGVAKVLAGSIKAEAKAAEESIAEAFKKAITQCTKHRMTKEEWEEAGEPPAPPSVISPCLLLPAVLDGEEAVSKIPFSFVRTETAWATHYQSADGTALFTDHRIAIIIHATECPDGIDEALRIAWERWGSVTARGPEAFLRLVAERADLLGIDVLDADGAPLAAMKDDEERAHPSSPPVVPDSAGWSKPDLADDLVRHARIERAISYLQDFDGLLLRRREMPGDTKESGRRGPLEIVLNDDPMDGRNEALAQHAMFDDNELVQRFLEQKRKEMLESWSLSLLNSSLDPSGMSARDMANCLPSRYEARRPAFLALEDFDCIAMLLDVRKRIQRRVEVQSGRGRALETQSSTPSQENALPGIQLMPEVDAGVPVETQLAVQQQRSGIKR